MGRRLGSLVLATLLLAGCDVLAPPESPGPVVHEVPAPPPEPAEEAELMPADGVSGQPPLPRRKPEEAAAAPLKPFHPDLLVGLDFNATKALLGDPALQLDEPPAKIWAYNGGTCMFNVFFYPSVDDNVFRVLTYEVTRGNAEPAKLDSGAAGPASVTVREKDSVAMRQCFADLLHSLDAPDAG